MSLNRNYNYKDVDMLMASKTIAESFKANISELSTTRTDWTEQYADELIGRIDSAIENNLGVDVKKVLRDATASLVAIQIPAKRDLSYFKTQVDDDFKKDSSKKNEILKTLGFSKHLKGVQKGNQESLLQLLYTFRTNITASLRADITSQGMNPTLIDKIVDYADTFREANTIQENLKETTKEITQEITSTFNAIYDEIVGICKKASVFYQYEPLKKEQFTFSKAIANLGAARKVAEEAI
ncbi:MAG TPA: hypothetical protein DDX98_15870 [Bacteroidales bacterium]|jgi:hypothetical protein|nr:hypothetical protein [Bacteroidales bacterium]